MYFNIIKDLRFFIKDCVLKFVKIACARHNAYKQPQQLYFGAHQSRLGLSSMSMAWYISSKLHNREI